MNSTDSLPVRGNLRPYYLATLIIAGLTAAASVLGLAFPQVVYPSEELLQGFMTNDVINLAVGLPILLGAIWAARRGRLLGLLFWPGALFFVIYNYLAYIFALPASWVYLLHLLIAVLSVYALAGLLASMDSEALKLRLEGQVSEKFSGGVLVVMGAFFMLRVIGVIAGAVLMGEPVPAAEMAVSISDFFISPALIIAGVMLWRHKALGYAAGLGLLFQASMLFIGLVAFFLLQPVLTSAPFALVDTIVVFLMGLVCYIPTVLFARGGRGRRLNLQA